ncbi:MAG: hypothetical protein QNJ60_06070 [Xenococcaceae cyanobacterium MO_188.B19]|nr:hypothetical protein [Xenococcaceae cyanobacterium MO_188.B19]
MKTGGIDIDMVNPTPRSEAYESGILAQLIKNAERLAVIESQISQMNPEVQKISELEKKVNVIYGSLKWVFTMLGTILIAIVANIFTQPILNWLS